VKQQDQKPIREARKQIAEVKKSGVDSLLLMQMNLWELPRQIASLKNLKSLSVPMNQLQSLGPALELRKLKFLSLSENPYFGALAELKAFNKLTELQLSGCKIRSLQELPVLPHLEKIDLSNNSIQDISKLSQFPALNRIIINKNSISSLRPLRSLLERGIEIYGKWSLGYSFANQYVYFKENPLTDPPYSIAKEGSQAVLRYWQVHEDKKGANIPFSAPAAAPKAVPLRTATAVKKRPSVAEISQAREAVREDRLREAITILRPFLAHPELLEGGLRELENQLVEGIISVENASLKRAQLRKSVLLAAGQVERGE